MTAATATIRRPVVTIYTDGACKGNPGRGGWGAWLSTDEHQKELFGGEALTTNNRMELTAVIEALASLKRTCDVILYTDSNYVRQGITEWIHGWKRREWKTADQQAGEERRPLATPGRAEAVASRGVAVGQGAFRRPRQRACRCARQPGGAERRVTCATKFIGASPSGEQGCRPPGTVRARGLSMTTV